MTSFSLSRSTSEACHPAAGVSRLAEGIAASHIHVLDLRDCAFTGEGSEVMLAALGQLRSLKTLKLDENGLGLSGASAIAEAVAKSSSLTELHISNTSIGDEGMRSTRGSLFNLLCLAWLHGRY